MTHYGRSGEEIRGEIGRWSLSHTCMKTSARSRFWIRETGKASINGHMPSKSRETKEKARSFPQLTSFPSHLCRTTRASHPIAPPPSHVPPLVNCHQENWPPGRKPYMRMARLSSLSLPLSAHEAQRGGRGENGVWRGSRKTEPPPRDKKNTLVQRANSRPSRSAAALAQGPSAALCLFG